MARASDLLFQFLNTLKPFLIVALSLLLDFFDVMFFDVFDRASAKIVKRGSSGGIGSLCSADKFSSAFKLFENSHHKMSKGDEKYDNVPAMIFKK